MQIYYVMYRQTTVSAYFTTKQILLYALALRY